MNEMMKYGVDGGRIAEAEDFPGLFLGRVVSQSREIYKVVTAKGEVLAAVSGRLRYAAEGLPQYPAVGDFVMLDREDAAAGNAVIMAILRRRSVFERAAAGTEHQTQVVAANIDTLFICMSLNENYSLNRLERYLSAAWSSGAVPVAVLTKSDLCSNRDAVIAEITAAAPGVEVVMTSRFDPSAAEKLLRYIGEGKTASFVGSSGVGKSTLINLLAGREALATSEIRADGRGRHTTTRRELIALPEGGAVIDTPGMREFGFAGANVDRAFSDIDELAARCRFSDCTHTGEPGCAVRKAVEEGVIDERRLESYKKLRREAKYDGLNSRELENAKLSAMFAGVGGMKNARKYIRDTDKRKGKN